MILITALRYQYCILIFGLIAVTLVSKSYCAKVTAPAAPAADEKDDDDFDALQPDIEDPDAGTGVETKDKKPKIRDPAQIIEMIKENMTLELTQTSTRDWTDLSSAILGAAWSNNGNKTEISVLELMKWFENVGGEERLYLLRILELMDKNMNGRISKDEFISLYAGPMASPDKAIEILHRIQDYDGNGHITLWETLTEVLTIDGINRNIYDKYRESAFTNRKMDANYDLSVNLHEFTNYMVWQMNLGVHSEHNAHKAAQMVTSTAGPIS